MEKSRGELILEELKAKKENKKIETIFDDSNWSLYESEKALKPLKFSNGKTQEDVVKETLEALKEGNKIILIKGVCGTGKSAIALNVARKVGKTSIVVPLKSLQKQYEKDYTRNKYLLKPNGEKLKITLITGRDNHDSVIKPGFTCADPFLPETIKINEKNYSQIADFYKNNPLISLKENPEIKDIKRISIAPANPYWSPILPARLDVHIPDAKKKKYKGLSGNDFIFYHRKEGCSYYDQYQSYIDSDVIIFNASKYKIETELNRKPETELEIIDEADEFLDNFSSQQNLNLTKIANSISTISPAKISTKLDIKRILEIIKHEETNKRVLGIDESEITLLKDSPINKIIKIVLDNPEIEDEISFDETSYANKLIEAAHEFKEFLSETYVNYRKYEEDLHIGLVTTNLSKRLKTMIDKNKAFILMSGTFHSEIILKEVFGLKDFKVIEAETKFPGTIEIERTGKEFDCKYSTFQQGNFTKRDYLINLNECVKKAKKPLLIHINAFEDLPSNEEISRFDLYYLTSKEDLIFSQKDDKDNNAIDSFKQGKNPTLFTTKCSRGVDFPGETCNSIIFTKYPNPNPNDTFWKILKKTHSQYFWEFYKDKAHREFLQKIYRGLRSENDFVQILSPDTRVLDAVRSLQFSNKNI